MMRKSNLTKTISITSGKGGVGKTTVTANLAQQLAEMGKRVLILDGDLGMANVDIFFATKAKGHLYEVLQGQKTVAEIITPLGNGIDLISGGSGITEFNKLTPYERRALVDSVAIFEYQYDYLLIDTAPGISDNVLYMNSAAQEIAVIITPDAASFADSYALIKVLNQQFREQRFNILCNMVKDENDGILLYQRFTEVVHRFLNLSLDYWGSIPTDPLFRKSAKDQRLAMRHEQGAGIRQYFSQIGSRIETGYPSVQGRPTNKAGLQFFWEQVVGVA
jgi:flagellar biosynthesis protein FlhG